MTSRGVPLLSAQSCRILVKSAPSRSPPQTSSHHDFRRSSARACNQGSIRPLLAHSASSGRTGRPATRYGANRCSTPAVPCDSRDTCSVCVRIAPSRPHMNDSGNVASNRAAAARPSAIGRSIVIVRCTPSPPARGRDGRRVQRGRAAAQFRGVKVGSCESRAAGRRVSRSVR